MATKRLKNYFFKITQTALKRGVRFRTGDKPEQKTFEDLIESSIFSTESKDRAKEDTGGFNSDTNGHVVAATDAQAKANQAKPTDRTLAVQPSQLPTVDSSDTLEVTSNNVSYNDIPLEVEITESTRNQFNLKLRDSFKTFIVGLVAFIDSIWVQVNINTSNITNLTGSVSQNTSDILALSPGGIPSVVPIGSVSMWLSDSALPVGYLSLDGAEVEQSAYASLFGLLGAKYNDGSESPGYFRLPNMSNRSPRGFEENSTITRLNTPQVLGGTHGSDGIYLESDNLPAHTHYVDLTTIDNIGVDGAHGHTWSDSAYSKSSHKVDGDDSGGTNSADDSGTASINPNSGQHNHRITGDTSPNTTTGKALEIIPSVMLTKFIIKAL